MKWFRHIGIFYKFNAIIIGMLLLNLLMGAFIIQTAFRLVEDQMEKRGAELAAYIGALSSNDILLDDRYALLDRINRTTQNTDDVRYIIITDSAGRILAHTFADHFPQGLPVITATKDSFSGPYRVAKYDSNEGLIREVSLPIDNGAVGYVRVGLSEKNTEKMLEKRLRDFVAVVMLVSAFAAGSATYLAFVIISPLRYLTRAAEQISYGNFSVQAEALGKDEVGKLAAVFNEMVASLRDKQLENDLLLKELRAKEKLRAELIKKLFTVQEEERKRLSRELHDETGQLLASLLAYMKLLLSKITDDEQKKLLHQAREVAIDALGELRKTAVELRPPVLDDLGLPAAMTKYIQTFSEQQGIKMQFYLPESQLNLGDEVSLALYRILQESLTNIAKHAKAQSVYVSLTASKQHVELVIKDDGMGMNNAGQYSSRKNNLGIYGMRERAELLGGTFQIEQGEQQGTMITVTLPKSIEVV